MHLTLSRETAIGIAVSTIAVAAMAVDHLLGQDPGLEDVGTFLLSCGLTLTLAVVVFGIVVHRAKADSATAARRGAVLGVVGVVLLFTIWLGLPFPVAGGGLALGLAGRHGSHRKRATVAIALGAVVLLLGVADYTEQAIRKT